MSGKFLQRYSSYSDYSVGDTLYPTRKFRKERLPPGSPFAYQIKYISEFEFEVSEHSLRFYLIDTGVSTDHPVISFTLPDILEGFRLEKNPDNVAFFLADDDNNETFNLYFKR